MGTLKLITSPAKPDSPHPWGIPPHWLEQQVEAELWLHVQQSANPAAGVSAHTGSPEQTSAVTLEGKQNRKGFPASVSQQASQTHSFLSGHGKD